MMFMQYCFMIFFLNADVVGTHLKCLNLSRQLLPLIKAIQMSMVPTTNPNIKK